MERKVFRGVGVVIAGAITHRKFNVVAKIAASQVVDLDRARHFEVDLDRTPSRAASWADVMVDDRGIDRDRRPLAGAPCTGLLTGYHVTNIGGHVAADRPDDLVQGCFVGGVYLEDSYFEAVRSRIDLDGNPWPCGGRRPHQLTTVAYSNHPGNGPRCGMRYAGFDARVVQRLGGSRLRLALHGIFDGPPLGELELDLAAPAHCDPDPPLAPGEPPLSPGSQAGDSGAVFVELGQLAIHQFENPKLPVGLES